MYQLKNNAISPFDFVKSINDTKENLITDDWSEDQYNAFIVNKALSFTPDTIIYANEMNSRPHLEKVLQYQFLINKARQVVSILSKEQIDDIKSKLYKGGK